MKVDAKVGARSGSTALAAVRCRVNAHAPREQHLDGDDGAWCHLCRLHVGEGIRENAEESGHRNLQGQGHARGLRRARLRREGALAKRK